MGTEINEIIRQTSPDYQRAYTEGFEDMKRATIKRLKEMIQEVEKLEAFRTVSTTASTDATP